MSGCVYIVHCVDTEGPLYESLDATFDRIKHWFGVELAPTHENMLKLQNKEINLEGKEEAVANLVRSDQLDYRSSWDQLYEMYDILDSEEYRNEVLDSDGNGYRINWFVFDHVGFKTNPRRRTLGYGAIFNEYLNKLEKYNLKQDALYLHFHPMSFSREAHRAGLNISFSNVLNESIARKIIDYNWFPAAHRPTCTEHVDLNIWLEQWVPFDFANNNKESDELMESEVRAGRFPYRLLDWRGAPTDWSVYNPSVWDARKKGNLNRYIARCLGLKSRHTTLSASELEKAFKRAESGKDTLVSTFNHDFRDMVSEVNELRDMVTIMAGKYPNVPFLWSNAVEAFREVLKLPYKKPPEIEMSIVGNALIIKSDCPLWGPQPFLAIKTKEKRYYHDNLAHLEGNSWAYVFDDDSIQMDLVSQVGIGTNDKYGNTVVVTSEVNDLHNYNTTCWNTKETQ